MGCSYSYFDARRDHTIRINCKEQINIYNININAIAYFQVITVRAPGEKIYYIGFFGPARFWSLAFCLYPLGLVAGWTGVVYKSHTLSCTPRRRPRDLAVPLLQKL